MSEATPPDGTSVPPRLSSPAILSLLLGILSLPTLAGLGIGALTSIVLGIVALVQVRRAPREVRGRGLAIGGIACAVSSVVLLMVIPELLIRTSDDLVANEKAAVRDLRALVAAQEAYAAVNGAYDLPACLVSPQACLRDPAPGTSPFVEASLLADAGGYRKQFHPGPRLAPEEIEQLGASPTSLRSYAWVAHPIIREPGSSRGICADSTGRLCFAANDSAPAVVDGACGEGCSDP